MCVNTFHWDRKMFTITILLVVEVFYVFGFKGGPSPKCSCFSWCPSLVSEKIFQLWSLAMWNNPVEQNLFLQSKEATSSQFTLQHISSAHQCTLKSSPCTLCTLHRVKNALRRMWHIFDRSRILLSSGVHTGQKCADLT